MSHKEDQDGELEALESIYCEELEFIERDPLAEFTITLKSEHHDDEDPEKGALVRLKFAFTKNYPDEAPEMAVEAMEGLVSGGDEESSLMEYLSEQANENLGMVMIFTLASAALEWLNQQCDVAKKKITDEAERIAREKEEEEHRRFEGTRVNVESFMKWKLAFEQEFFGQKRAKQNAAVKKLTGKEMFLTDKTLNESDLKFLEEGGGEAVKVDESLFENLEDLDLDEMEESEEP